MWMSVRLVRIRERLSQSEGPRTAVISKCDRKWENQLMLRVLESKAVVEEAKMNQ